jgi:hypothetical protein
MEDGPSSVPGILCKKTRTNLQPIRVYTLMTNIIHFIHSSVAFLPLF